MSAPFVEDLAEAGSQLDEATNEWEDAAHGLSVGSVSAKLEKSIEIAVAQRHVPFHEPPSLVGQKRLRYGAFDGGDEIEKSLAQLDVPSLHGQANPSRQGVHVRPNCVNGAPRQRFHELSRSLWTLLADQPVPNGPAFGA